MREAQSILESSVVFVAGCLIVGAAIAFFVWGSAHIPIRQISYEASRIAAGTPSRRVDHTGAATGIAHEDAWPTYHVSGAGLVD